MGVSVGLRRPAVGRPACVADPYAPDHRIAIEECLEILEFTLATPDRNSTLIDNRNPSGIVAPIFELSQAFQD